MEWIYMYVVYAHFPSLIHLSIRQLTSTNYLRMHKSHSCCIDHLWLANLFLFFTMVVCFKKKVPNRINNFQSLFQSKIKSRSSEKLRNSFICVKQIFSIMKFPGVKIMYSSRLISIRLFCILSNDVLLSSHRNGATQMIFIAFTQFFIRR